MSTRYLKLKPSNDFFRKHDIKNFEIECVNLFSQKRKMEIYIKVNSYEAGREIEDLRHLLYKNFEAGLKLRIKMDVNSELIVQDVVGFVKFVIENYKFESKRYQYIFANYEVESLEDVVYVKLPSHHLIEEAQKTDVANELTKKIYESVDNTIKVEFVNGDFKEIKAKIKAQHEKLNSISASELPKYDTPNNNNNNYSNDGNFNGNGNGNGNGFKRKKNFGYGSCSILNAGYFE